MKSLRVIRVDVKILQGKDQGIKEEGWRCQRGSWNGSQEEQGRGSGWWILFKV